jgi:cardiolipin synthase
MRLYYSSTDAWTAIYEACEQARNSISLEEYIFRDDSIGSRLLDILMAKSRAGVRVRLLLDAFGSRRMRQNAIVADLKAAGVKLVFFRPMNLVQRMVPPLGLPRDHAKALHIDGTTCFIGSMGVAQHMAGWRDTLVMLQGKVAQHALADFDRVWCREAFNLGYPPNACTSASEAEPDHFVAQIPEFKTNTIRELLLAKIATAQQSILIATPYFFPPQALRRALLAAHRRGVLITLMLASQTDVPLADGVTRALIKQWRSLGFEVVFYQPEVLHAKYAIIDSVWATVGSCNFDFLSLVYNREVNVVLGNQAYVLEFVAQSEIDLGNCAPTPASASSPNTWDSWIGQIGALVCRYV